MQGGLAQTPLSLSLSQGFGGKGSRAGVPPDKKDEKSPRVHEGCQKTTPQATSRGVAELARPHFTLHTRARLFTSTRSSLRV